MHPHRNKAGSRRQAVPLPAAAGLAQ